MRLRTGLAAMVVAAGLLTGVGVTEAAATGAPYCGITWGSLPRSDDTYSAATLLTTRTGQHSCFDRVVFEFSGPVDGYRVGYGEPFTPGEGLALRPYLAGGAVLTVELLAPAYDEGLNPTYPYRSGEHVANVVRYRTLRDAMLAGSREGETTFAVGVRARLPFRVFTLAGPGSHSRIVIDIGHQWQQ